MSVDTGIAAAERGHVVGTLLSGGPAKPMYDAYRKRAAELGWKAGPDRMAYAAIVGVGDTREEGLRRADHHRGLCADGAGGGASRSPIRRAITRSVPMWRC